MHFAEHERVIYTHHSLSIGKCILAGRYTKIVFQDMSARFLKLEIFHQDQSL
jgi:hypothetical protein